MIQSSRKFMTSGIPLFLTLLFLILKLTSVIDWSWFWVFSPLIFTFALTGVVALGAIVVMVIVTAMSFWPDRS